MRRVLPLLCLPLCPLALAACAGTTTTAGFKGEQHEAAQAVANLQANATAGEEKKICAGDLAADLVARLGGAKGCEAAIKSQLAEVDSLQVSIQSVKAAPDASTATARVTSIYEGKNRTGTVELVKESGKWKVSGLG
jgi:copper chaperone CopZ